jgi:hypothetical protein
MQFETRHDIFKSNGRDCHMLDETEYLLNEKEMN